MYRISNHKNKLSKLTLILLNFLFLFTFPTFSQDKDFVKLALRFAEPAIDLEDERNEFKDEVGPMIEAAGEIRDDFVQGLKEGVQSDVFRSIISIFFTVLALVVGLWLIANHVAPAWERSGSQYSEGLKELAPKLRDKNKSP